MKIGDHYGNRPDPRAVTSGKVLKDTRFGVEVELENCALRRVDSKYWLCKEDGSLRSADGHSVELVFAHPYAGNDAEEAINELDQLLKELKPRSSERCGTHIHIDVRDLEEEDYYRFVAALYFVEPILFHMFAPTREANAFCLPHYMFVHDNKYRGINIAATREYGSVEVRLYCQNDSTDGLLEKMRILENVRRNSVSFTGEDTSLACAASLLGVDIKDIPITSKTRLCSSALVAVEFIMQNVGRGHYTKEPQVRPARNVVIQARAQQYVPRDIGIVPGAFILDDNGDAPVQPRRNE